MLKSAKNLALLFTYTEYKDEKTYFRKRHTPEMLGEINKMIIEKAENETIRKEFQQIKYTFRHRCNIEETDISFFS